MNRSAGAPVRMNRSAGAPVRMNHSAGAPMRCAHSCSRSLTPYFAPVDPHLCGFYKRKSTRALTSPNITAPVLRGCKPTLRASVSSKPMTAYEVAIRTANDPLAGTDAKVYITIYGDEGKISKKRLAHGKSHGLEARACYFAPGTVEKFRIRSPSIGELLKIDVEHSGLTEDQGWLLADILITEATSRKKWLFKCDKWLSLHHSDCQTRRTLLVTPTKGDPPPVYIYTIHLYTGNVRGAGTDANVFVTLSGRKGTTPKTQVTNCRFTSGSVDVFTLTTTQRLGELQSLTVEHDNTGFGPSWFLDKIIVSGPTTDKKILFPCGVWLSREEGDREICRVLYPGHVDQAAKLCTYIVSTITGQMKGAGTDAIVFTRLHGASGTSEQYRLENNRNNFERGRRDTFRVRTVNIGKLQCVSVILKQENSSTLLSWFLDYMEVQVEEEDELYLFPCHQWLSPTDSRATFVRKELFLQKNEDSPKEARQENHAAVQLILYQYVLWVTTGSHAGSSSNANVYVVLHGEGKSSERLWLDCNSHLKYGQRDRFDLSISTLVSPVTRISIGHDSPRLKTSWFLEKAELECCTTGQVARFIYHGWMCSDNGKIEKDLLLLAFPRQVMPWKVTIWTSNLLGAGTDANVFIQAIGEAGKSSKKLLLDGGVESFERGQEDIFEVELEDLGTLSSVIIGHDNSGPYPDWHLDRVELMLLTSGTRYLCPCGHWLSADKGDGTTVKLDAMLQGVPSSSTQHYDPTYESCKETDESIQEELSSIGSPTQELVKSTDQATTLRNQSHSSDIDVHITYIVHVTIALNSKVNSTAHLVIVLIGDELVSDPISLRPVFQGGKTETFSVVGRDVGGVNKVRISLNSPSTKDRWLINEICLTNPGNAEVQHFFCGKWVEVGIPLELSPAEPLSSTGASSEMVLRPQNHESIGPMLVNDAAIFDSATMVGNEGPNLATGKPDDEEPKSLVAYEVKFVTADKKHAGTPHTVHLVIIGESGPSNVFTFKNSSRDLKFQRGQTDVFCIGCKDIGILKAVRIAHVPKRKRSVTPDHSTLQWYLFEVCLTRLVDKKKFHFLCRRWIPESRAEDLHFSEVPVQS